MSRSLPPISCPPGSSRVHMHPYSSPEGSRGWFSTNGHSPFVTGYRTTVKMHVVAASAYSSAASNRRISQVFPVPRILYYISTLSLRTTVCFRGKERLRMLRILRGHRPILARLESKPSKTQCLVVGWNERHLSILRASYRAKHSLRIRRQNIVPRREIARL